MNEQLKQGVSTFIGLLTLAPAFGILFFPIMNYLIDARWRPLSVVDALRWLDVDWAGYPQSWLGLHRVLEWAPLSLSWFVVGLAVFILWISEL